MDNENGFFLFQICISHIKIYEQSILFITSISIITFIQLAFIFCSKRYEKLYFSEDVALFQPNGNNGTQWKWYQSAALSDLRCLCVCIVLTVIYWFSRLARVFPYRYLFFFVAVFLTSSHKHNLKSYAVRERKTANAFAMWWWFRWKRAGNLSDCWIYSSARKPTEWITNNLLL